MILYADNRIDSPVELTPADAAERFWRTEYAGRVTAGATLTSQLLNFLMDVGSFDRTEPGVNDAYEDVFDAVRAAAPA